MNKLSNIDWDSVKAFIKDNTLLCALAILDIFLFVLALQRGSANDALQESISNMQLKEKQIKANLTKLTRIEKDFGTIKAIKADILKKCINFGKKTTVFNFLKQVDGFLSGKKLSVSNTNLYDINKNRNINFNQDLEEFDGDNVLASCNVSFAGGSEDLSTFLEKLNALPYFINLQKLEMRKNSNGDATLLNVNLSFSVLGKIQLRDNDA